MSQNSADTQLSRFGDRPLRILSLDGGGYLGLATASFIRSTEDHFGTPFHERFDLFCGTSTGAILALGLALGKTGSDLVELYKRYGRTLFRRRLLRRGLFRARYNNNALRGALQDQFNTATLNDLWAHNKAALVTAYNVTTGEPRVFKTDHSPDLTRDGRLTLVDVALASTAAPTYFPLVKVTDPSSGVEEIFCDGGVVANHPALLGYAEAITTLGALPANIRILSVSTPRLNLGEGLRKKRHGNRGVVGWAKSLPAIFVDSGALTAHNILERIVKSYSAPQPVYERVAMVNRDNLSLDEVSERSTSSLCHQGTHTASDGATRARVRTVLFD